MTGKNPSDKKKKDGSLPEPLAYPVDVAAYVSASSRSALYEAKKAGQLKFRKQGRHTIILRDDLMDWLKSLPVSEASL